MRNTPFVLLAGLLTLSPMAQAKPGSREKTCAALEKETRAHIAAAIKAGSSPLGVDDIARAISPLGTCAGSVVKGGSWALELTAPPQLEQVDVLIDNGLGGTGEEGAGEDHTPSMATWVVVRDWTPVFVTAAGERIRSESPPTLPGYDDYLGEDGNAVSPHFPFEPDSVDAVIAPTPFPDGSLGAAFAGRSTLVGLVRFDGKTIQADPAHNILPIITSMRDIDQDGRLDLLDADTMAVHLYGDGNYSRPFDIVAIGQPDGSYSITHPNAIAHYRKTCEGLGRSPWLLGRKTADEAITNIACGRLFGVSATTIGQAIELEKAARGDTYDDEAWENFSLFEKGLPLEPTREDGLRVVPVVSAVASAAMKAFGVYRFDASQAVDGDLGSSWQPAKTKGKGAMAALTLELGPKTSVVALDIANGLQRTDKLGDLFALNSRATLLLVEAGDKSFELKVDPDKRGYQRLDLPEPVETTSVRITVKASAKGSRWDHVALSEVVVLTR